jgi:hypothetical protein
MDLSCPPISVRGPLTFVHTPFGLTLPEIDQKCRTDHVGCVVEFGLTVRDDGYRTGITARDAGRVVALGNQTPHISHDMHRLTHRSLQLSSI